jgi:hypothetical protein
MFFLSAESAEQQSLGRSPRKELGVKVALKGRNSSCATLSGLISLASYPGLRPLRGFALGFAISRFQRWAVAPLAQRSAMMCLQRWTAACLWLFFLVLLLTGPGMAFQETKHESPTKPALTEEEKEILKDREILENLDLLQDFEKFRYFDYFAAEEGPKPIESQKPTAKKVIKKEEKKKK